MFDFSNMPSSSAVPFLNINETNGLEGLRYTTKEGLNEDKLYSQMNNRLTLLETSTNIHQYELETIEQAVTDFVFSIDAKEELRLRIDWLHRLYIVQNSINSVTKPTEVNRLRNRISSVQTCPLKNKLIEQLTVLEQTLEQEEIKLSNKDALIETILETGNETFINLGISGRNVVIEEALKGDGDGKVETVINKAKELEATVQAVKQLKTIESLRQGLEALPLQNFPNIPAEYQVEVLQKLLDNPNWNGLLHLDRFIHQYTIQIKSLHEPKQEGPQTILKINDKLMKQLGLKQA